MFPDLEFYPDKRPYTYVDRPRLRRVSLFSDVFALEESLRTSALASQQPDHFRFGVHIVEVLSHSVPSCASAHGCSYSFRAARCMESCSGFLKAATANGELPDLQGAKDHLENQSSYLCSLSKSPTGLAGANMYISCARMMDTSYKS